MEARTSFSGGASVSRTFVAVILVIVAMGLAAMAGYLARTVVGGAAAVTTQQTIHAAPGTVLRQDNPSRGAVELPAPGTVLRQDNPSRGAVELPGWAQREIEPKASPRTVQDDPGFISQYYAVPAQAERSTGHKELA